MDSARLPLLPNRFVGRTAEKERLSALLHRHRLVSVVGPGGCGKTRLSVEVVRETAPELGLDVAFVDLSALRDSRAVVSDAARQVGVTASPDEELFEAFVRTLDSNGVLLLLDNCEQVLDGCSELVAGVLERCPRLRVLTTSREPLRLPSERVWRLPPLSVPPTSSGAEDLAHYESVELLQDRVDLAGGTLSAAEASSIVELCGRLDGLPLAIELAAAWIPVLGVTGVEASLSRGVDLVSDSPHATADRHRSLRTALEHSDGLLTPPERRLWRRLSVFAPGFDLEAVEAICADATPPIAEDVPRLLRRLVECSLVQLEPGDGLEGRWRLLETVRECGLQLLAAGGELPAVAEAHARHYLRRAEVAWSHRDAADLVEQAKRMTADHANVRFALDWLHEHDHEGELQLAGAMGWVWGARPLLPDGRRLLERAVRGTRSQSWHGGRALRAAGMLALEQGDGAAARDRFEQALRMFEALGDEAGEAFCLARLGALDATTQPARARTMLERAADLAGRTGDLPTLINATANLGALELERGSPTPARRHFEEAVRLCRTMEHARWLPQILEGLAQSQLSEGDHGGARRSAVAATEMAEKAGFEALLPSLLETLATVAARAGEPERALRLAGAASARRSAGGAALPHPWPATLAAALRNARRLCPGVADDLWKEGQSLPAAEVIRLALSEGGELDRPPALKAISRRQAHVAVLVAEGLTNAEIASRLSVSERTAEWHLEELRNRLGFNSRSQIAAWAVAEGLAGTGAEKGRGPGEPYPRPSGGRPGMRG